MNNNLTAAEEKGYNTILNLTDEELIGTLRLEPVRLKKNQTPVCTMFENCQSRRFSAALCDPRTSFEFKFNEIFEIVEPQNVEYKKFSVKLALKSHPTSALSEEDINNIKAFIDGCYRQHHLNIFMRPDLNISDVITYLNKFGSLKSDKEIDDDICKINMERIPRVLIHIGSAGFLKSFHQLLNFYSDSFDTSYSSPYKLIGKVFQKQRSNFISIEETIPHRNCVYFFRPFKSNSEDFINSEFLQSFIKFFECIDIDNSSLNLDNKFYSIYDMKCSNDRINIKNNNDLYEDKSLPNYSDIKFEKDL
ncbi:hypothetical protein BN7_4392 [Wickerhamomyces ciferrii]|uniref:Uncharacterized protein n=1 Tax=Wickerhamomyces ciferrii (strain ATCC 14091 / BCRC 22168 / CBS 111 / JCM 3599 / NBRC 0793 / NRRL Y-1031 F-60-10) TaxID=1206466 RepID=K0KUF4_WICCF|nr:uncharacterized protein BN7_4392 [Wickerhamomyces ciferrii]CCH44823.1 hypothetical protein BN7_4392 [Wickerhamomyces ciferrii]